jgi:hypothetical protein
MADLAQRLMDLSEDQIQHCVLAIAGAQVTDLTVWSNERATERICSPGPPAIAMRIIRIQSNSNQDMLRLPYITPIYINKSPL